MSSKKRPFPCTVPPRVAEALKKQKLDEKKADKSVTDPLSRGGRLSWQACDEIATSLLQPRETDKMRTIDILADFKCVDAKELQTQFYEKKLIPPTVVNQKGHKDDPAFADVVNIGRAQTQGGWNIVHDSKLANPIRLKWKKPDGKVVTHDECMEMFGRYMKRHPELLVLLEKLSGKKIGCWCVCKRPKAGKCHGGTADKRSWCECVHKCHGGVILKLFCELFVPPTQAV